VRKEDVMWLEPRQEGGLDIYDKKREMFVWIKSVKRSISS